MKLFRTTDHTTADDETSPDENAAPAMSQPPAQTAADTRPVSTGLARASEAAAEPTTTYQDGGSPVEQPRPTFTPAPASSADSTASSPDSTAPIADRTATLANSNVASVRPDPTGDGGDFTRPVAAATSLSPGTSAYDPAPAYDEPPTTLPASASGLTLPMDEPAAIGTPAASGPASRPAGEPLLADSAGMRASWQKVQAGFVDDPRAAVTGAADLIEQATRSLVDALQQRQRELRDTVAGDPAGSNSATASGTSDTEHLRLLMQRYRALFDRLCQA